MTRRYKLREETKSEQAIMAGFLVVYGLLVIGILLFWGMVGYGIWTLIQFLQTKM